MQTQSAEGQCFKTYTGTKTIKAMPMDARHAKDAGATVPDKYFEVGHASYNPGADGYLVAYPDGYMSWSPKKVFEEAYRISETPEDNLKIELADLNTRMKVISDMLYNPNHIGKCEDRYNLNKQLDAMREYAEQLRVRLECLTAPRVVAVDTVGHGISCSGKKAEGGV